MSTIKVNSIKNTSTDDGGIAIDNSGHVQIDGQQLPTTGALSHRNLVINGAMAVSQRSTSETGLNTAGFKTVDRMRLSVTSLATARFTHEQSTDAPDGFAYSVKTTTTTAEGSVGAADGFRPIEYIIEGQDLQHLAYGTSSAKSLTLSFHVKSSVTGTYSIAVYRDESTDRLITATYTINSASTWEYKTITIPGDTSASITNDNANRFAIYFHAGAGSAFKGTDSSGSWGNYSNAGFANGTTVNLQNTLNATWQATGLQLEVGSKATSFEHRSYGDELLRCLRYYEQSNPTLSGSDGKQSFVASNGSDFLQGPTFKVTKRAAPTMAGHDGISEMDGSSSSLTIGSFMHIGVNGALRLSLGGSGRINGQVYRYHWSADAEL